MATLGGVAHRMHGRTVDVGADDVEGHPCIHSGFTLEPLRPEV